MDTATITPDQETATPVEESVPERTEVRIFRFSDFVHVGEGSAECPHGEDGRCKDPEHFHAWIRLPNKFQIVQIREKGQAARARVLRQARDKETDRWEIIENQVAESMSAGRDGVIAEILGHNEWKVYRQAMAELVNDDDGEGEGEEPRSPWADIEADQERFRVLSSQPEEERNADEYGELSRHLAKWNETLDARLEELRAPEQEALEDRTDEELAEMVRERAITEQADSIFMRTYARWQMVVCTLKPNGGRPVDRIFGSPQQLEADAPEVIGGLEVAFNALENELNNRLTLRAEGN
jgi:nucleotide-binding universal stress UspA family protein